MLTRAIPSTGEQIPVIGIGTWQRFDVGKNESERQPLKEVLTEMKRLGGKLIDSSPMYGKSEQVVGDLTTELNIADDFFYATKVWTTGKQNGIDQMNDSMRKMKRDVMDLIQIHNLVDWQTHLQTLRQWKDEGRIRYIGITHYQSTYHDELERIITKEKIDFVQFNYSIRVRNAEKNLLNVARDKGVAVIINEPLEKGSLFKLVQRKLLPGWCSEIDINNWTEFFLKYIISHQAVTCVIPATSNPKHAIDNFKSGFGKLPDEATRKKMVDFLESL
jgi:diketogulonate reductase-like aldo/keto reductase